MVRRATAGFGYADVMARAWFLLLPLIIGCTPSAKPPPTATTAPSQATKAPSPAPAPSNDRAVQAVTEVPVETQDGCPRDLDALVGKVITLVGVQTRTRQPTVCGVDVDGDYELSDQVVRVTGKLHRTVVKPRPPEEPIVATRGPGTYYSIVDTQTRELARPVAK